MKLKRPEPSVQNDMFNTRLADLLNQRHELYQLEDLIDWDKLDKEFGQFFVSDKGAPAKCGGKVFSGALSCLVG